MLPVVGLFAVTILAVVVITTRSPVANAPTHSEVIAPNSFIAIILYIIFLPFALGLIILINIYCSKGINDIFKENRNTLLIIIGTVFSVLLFVTLVCFTVHPYDTFDNPPNDIEQRVCALISRADKFIEGAVGNKGMKTNAEGDTEDTPEHKQYVKEAQDAARNEVGGIWDCINPDISGDRMAILERTVRKFTGPIILHSFDTAMNVKQFPKCPNVLIPCIDSSITPLPDNADKEHLLWANAKEGLLEAIACQESLLLKPIDAKVLRMQSGKLEECEQTGAFASMKR